MGLLTYTFNLANANTAVASEVMTDLNEAKAVINGNLDTQNIKTKAVIYAVPMRLEGLVPLGTDAAGCRLWRHRVPAASRLVYVSARVFVADIQVSLQYSADGTFAAPIELLSGGLVTVAFGADPIELTGAAVNVNQQLAKGGRIRPRTASLAVPEDLHMVLYFKALLSTDDGTLA